MRVAPVRLSPLPLLALCACSAGFVPGSEGVYGGPVTVQSTQPPADINSPGTTDPNTRSGDPVVPWTLFGRMAPGDGDASAPQIMTWANSEVRVSVAGTASISFDVQVIKDAPIFTVTVDDGTPKVFAQPPISVALDPSTPHVVRLRKIVETAYGVAVFNGVTLDPQGRFLAPPSKSARRIEIIGDSISNGYGDLGGNVSCAGTASMEDVAQAYGPIAGDAVQADVRVIAWSGRGLTRNGDGTLGELMPEVWQRAAASDANSRWDFNKWVPHAVVIALGANDFAPGTPDAATFEGAYVKFIATVRKTYGLDPQIIIAYGPMFYGDQLDAVRTYVKNIVNTANNNGDAKVRLQEFSPQNVDSNGNGAGCGYHPNLAKQRSMATNELIPALKKALNW